MRRIPVRHTYSRARSAGGMTLIEVMIAAMLLLFASAGIVPLFLTGLSQASTVRYKSLASNIAREKMEEIRQLDYREIYTETNRTEPGNEGLSDRTLESLFGVSATERDATFVISYVVNKAAYQSGYLKEVTVNVTWNAPPTVSTASIATLVHQQFLGPRGSRLTIEPTYSDPLGTPFPLIATSAGPTSSKVRYYIAQADWNLVFNNLDTDTPVAKNTYLRLALYDDDGQSLAIGDASNKYMIDNSHLYYSRSANGAVDSVWFEYDFNPQSVPDGYWELRAVVFNIYDEPGNIWRLRVRVEKGAPGAPTSFVASPQSDNQKVVLNWAGGSERDRSRYVIQRRLWDGVASWLPWVTVVSDLDPRSATYTDAGSVAQARDPWGSDSTQHYYEYSVNAVDECQPGLAGASTVATVVMPPATTTTTLGTNPTTSSTSTTSTTVVNNYQVLIKNLSNTNYSLIIKNNAGTVVFSGAATKNKTLTVSGLTSGNYLITATANNKPPIAQSFSLPAQAGDVVFTIL